ncbi:MAG: membrane protein insertase YidC [Flavobacteriales bacterium]
MDKNQIIGIVLMVLLYIGYIWYTAPTEEEMLAAEAAEIELAEQQRLDSIASAEEATFQTQLRQLPEPTDSNQTVDPSLIERFGSLATASVGMDAEYTLETEDAAIRFSNRGGMPVESELKKFQRYQSDQNIALWDVERSEMNIEFEMQGSNRVINLKDLHFELESQTEQSITLVCRSDEGQIIRWKHTIKGHELSSNLTYENFGNELGESQRLVWVATGIPNEKGLDWERQHSSIYYKELGLGRDYLSDGRSDEAITEEPLEWVAFKQNFFSALVHVEGNFLAGASLQTNVPEEDSTATMEYRAELPFQPSQAGNIITNDFQFYFGPNEQTALEALELAEADRIIDYGWWIFGWVNRNAILPLYNFLASKLASAGLIILVITLIIKLALSPITWKNFMSSAKMRVLRPEIEELNKKHEDDAMAKQQATMALYRQTGVNPLAGCVPALLQMPILYAMFRFFPSNIGMRGESFLWADDLGAYDSIIDLPFSIPFYGAHVSGFTFLMAISTFLYMRMTMANQPPQPQQPGMPNMKVIQQIFPFMMLFFFNQFASGLSLYYLTANVISMGQMVVIKQFLIDEDKIREKIEANKAKPKKKSGFQERLEQMQKEQMAKTKEIKAKRKSRK